MYGVDIAQRRADDLDAKMLAYIAAQSGVSVLDLGSGAGGQSVRMADAGAQVFAVDILDHASKNAHPHVTYIQGDMRAVEALTKGKAYDMCCLQRAIHYIPYADACALLQTLKKIVYGPLYISFSGLESDIGAQYPDAGKELADRFCALPRAAADTFSITQPICLYTPEECADLLCATGWHIEELWVSAFGNSKALCT